MDNHFGKFCTVLALVLLLIPAGAMAAINSIGQGNTVFLGEQGLDIRSAMNGHSSIGWWASAASIGTTSPSYTISVANPSSFFISPTDFAGKLGTWYRLDSGGKADGIAFVVADPNLDLRIYDATVNVDASSNGWITAGDEVEFRITTNLYQMSQRGISGAPVTIKVQGPEGSVYSALINSAGTSTSIVDIPVGTSPYSTGAIWDTGRYDTYSSGPYRIWAECNANSMKDNYGQSGRTFTPEWGILDQESNPLIIANTHTVSVTPSATTKPATTLTTIPTAVLTTVQATVTTTATAVPTTLATQQMTTTVSAPMSSTAPTSKSPGFESALGCFALLIAIACIAKRD